jgi:hypothetical protein
MTSDEKLTNNLKMHWFSIGEFKYSDQENDEYLLELRKDIFEKHYGEEDRPVSAVYKPDIRVSLLEKPDSSYFRDFAELTEDRLMDAVLGDSEPGDYDYIELPLTQEEKLRIRSGFRAENGRNLVFDSIATRAWFALRTDIINAEKLIRDAKKPKTKNLMTKIVLGFYIYALITTGVTGFQKENVAQVLVMWLYWTACYGIFLWYQRKRRSKYQIESFDEKLTRFNDELLRAKRRASEFLKRNTWFEPALDNYFKTLDVKIDEFLVYLEAKAIRARQTDRIIDGTKLQDEAREDLVEELPKSPSKMVSFNANQFEIYCAGWVEHLGGKNVTVTQASADGGIDVVSDNEVAQVKLHGKPVSVQPVRELFGAAKALSKSPIFFSSAGYTKSAIDFAEQNDILLFTADPLGEELSGETKVSKFVLKNGLAQSSN